MDMTEVCESPSPIPMCLKYAGNAGKKWHRKKSMTKQFFIDAPNVWGKYNNNIVKLLRSCFEFFHTLFFSPFFDGFGFSFIA
jgi:hypothetical protein